MNSSPIGHKSELEPVASSMINAEMASSESTKIGGQKLCSEDETITNVVLVQMMKDQRDIISMMQIQMDMQAERLNNQEKALQELKAKVEKQLSSVPESSEPSEGNDKKVETEARENDWVSDLKSGDSLSVAAMVKQAAEETIANQAAATNYTYDEVSGLYYDHNSGYYYDAVRGLFYNGHTRTYYVYDQETKSYTFHSQLSEPEKTNKVNDKLPSKKKSKSKIKISVKSKNLLSPSSSPAHKTEFDDSVCKLSPSSKMTKQSESSSLSDGDIEEGELSSSTQDSSSQIGDHDNDNANAEDDTDTDTETIASQDSQSTSDSRKREENLPCIRALIMDANLPSLSKGFLYIVTCMGGSIGREGNMHSILIPDSSLSKHHADIHFSNEDGNFYITDLGSQNGTFLNGARLSEPKVPSEAHQILHGSTLKVGSTTLLIHIHPGSFTCGLCEPGLITSAKEPIYSVSLTKEKKEALRKKQLRKLRQKYGVEKHETESLSKLPEYYKDRAIERRVNKGSDNPYEKTQVASADVPIKDDNKGFRMLAKMGWNAGDALGRSPPHDQNQNQNTSQPIASHTLLEPIKVEIRPGRVGLGFQAEGKGLDVISAAASTSTTSNLTRAKLSASTFGHQNRAKIAKKTLERFNEISDKADGSSSVKTLTAESKLPEVFGEDS